MTTKHKLLVRIVLGFTLATLGCEKQPTDSGNNPPPPSNSRTYTITLKTSASAPVSGAAVSIQTRQSQYSLTTDRDGKAKLTIPNSVSLPSYVIVTADHESIKPEAKTFSGSANTSQSRTLTCESAPSRILIRHKTLHHIGDDHYGGDPNSQLQISTEGTRLSFTFNLSSIPSSMPHIRVFARGIQHPLQIKINGITTDRLGSSPSDGDLGRYTYQLTANPATVFRIGTNTLTLESFYVTNESDWDDLEFCGLLLYYP